MRPRNWYPVLLTLGLLGFAADQVSKYEVFRRLYDEGRVGRVPIIDGAFELLTQHRPIDGKGLLQTYSGLKRPYVNQGALFGLGGDSKETANLIFAIVSVLAAVGIVLWGRSKSVRADRWLSTALGLILGGTLGNMYDRFVFSGVRDFLHWYKWYDWPVFNFADCCLVAGAAMLFLQAIFSREEPKPAPVAEAPAKV